MNTPKETPAPKGMIYLVPNLLGDAPLQASLPQEVQAVVQRLSHFIVEDEKSARKFLKACGVLPPYDKLHFYHLDKYTRLDERLEILKAIQGTEAGILSEAGCPAVADPGSALVQSAHEQGYRVVPLVGPSSILLALMASGGNGQGFTFNGYLPVQPNARQQRLRELEQQAIQSGYTQIFIETPFRNEHVLADILRVCRPETWASVAIDITLGTEEIYTKRVQQWQKQPLPELKGRPAVFSLWAETAKKTAKAKYGRKN